MTTTARRRRRHPPGRPGRRHQRQRRCHRRRSARHDPRRRRPRQTQRQRQRQRQRQPHTCSRPAHRRPLRSCPRHRHPRACARCQARRCKALPLRASTPPPPVSALPCLATSRKDCVHSNLPPVLMGMYGCRGRSWDRENIWKHRGISVSSYYDQYHDPPAHPYVTRNALGADVTLIGWVMALWPMVYIAVRAQLSLHVSQPPWSLNRCACA
jgi:hypothetical protein